MSIRTLTTTITLLALSLEVGCSGDAPTSPSSAISRVRPSLDLKKKGEGGIELTQMRYADSIPGFGGYFFEKGDLVIYLTDTSTLSNALTSLQPLLAKYGAANGTIKAKPAQHNFYALMEWRHDFVMNAEENPGIFTIGIDKSRNRVRIGVADVASFKTVENLESQYNIPKDAVDVVVVPKERDFTDYLYTYAPNGLMAAGLQIQGTWSNTTLGPCTLGFNTFNGTFFVTNSHCTGVRGYEANPTSFFQPTSSGVFVGHEDYDPDYFNDAANKDCDSAFNRCRYSDASLIAYSTLAAPGSAGQGIIYTTTFASGILGDYGSREIAGTATIEDEASDTPQGITLHKVGAASGWTYGEVIATCQDVNASGWFYICQDQVAATGTFGDSGSPVFALSGSGTVTLYGILRGGTTDYFTFSPLHAIWAEVGYVPATN